MIIDIFISYRRSDAEVYARMLYNDLTAKGYSAFYDFKSIGAGDYLETIFSAIDECKDFIFILSKDALNERIFSENDVMREEITHAMHSQKRMIGIILTGFEGFPKKLPDELQKLPTINCLNGGMEYYDFMLEKLISGQFLLSSPRHFSGQPNTSSLVENSFESLAWFISQSVEKKQAYMKFMLDLAHEFNFNESCMRVYEYLDYYFRQRGLESVQPYTGRIPTDFATFLAFFEELCMIVITGTVDISIIDEGYRFRFFAGCNNPTIQESELLALGYQYPRIFALYDYWSEYVCKKHRDHPNGVSLFDAFPGFERDLIITHGLYCFAYQREPISIRFLNKNFDRKDFVFRTFDPDLPSLFIDFQRNVLSGMPENAEKNIFEPLTDDEIEYSVKNDICISVYEGEKLVALLSLIAAPKPSQNIASDLSEFADYSASQIMVIDAILVCDECRGFGIQRAFLRLTDFIAERQKIKAIFAVVSSENFHSESNFIKCGYRLVKNLPKYHSNRDYFVKLH